MALLLALCHRKGEEKASPLHLPPATSCTSSGCSSAPWLLHWASSKAGRVAAASVSN